MNDHKKILVGWNKKHNKNKVFKQKIRRYNKKEINEFIQNMERISNK